jgi:hypothetical protein
MFWVKTTGNIWQLIAVRWKAAKTLTYCILYWRLNALKLSGVLACAFPRSREGILIISRFLFDKPAVDAQSIPSPFEADPAQFLSV